MTRHCVRRLLRVLSGDPVEWRRVRRGSLPRIRPEQFDTRRTFRMVYETNYGRTQRVIRVRFVSIADDGVPVVKAFCFLRQEDRHFRADRMSNLARFEDGATIVDPVAFFRRWG